MRRRRKVTYRPSRITGIIGLVMGGIFVLIGVFVAIPASGLFGVLWTGIAAATTVYNFRNAAGKNRYSAFDITDASEEPDALNERFGPSRDPEETAPPAPENRFCPYCGTPVAGDYEYCNRCGRKLP